MALPHKPALPNNGNGCPKTLDSGRLRAGFLAGVDQVLRTITAESNQLYFSVRIDNGPGKDPTLLSVAEEDDNSDGFPVAITFPTYGPNGTTLSVHLTEPELQTLGRVIQQRFGEVDPLVGQFVHILKDGKIEKQGHIGRSPEPGYYLVTFFSSLDGEKNGSEIMKFTDMIDEDWVFYDDEEQWRSALTERVTRQREPQGRSENPFS
jgi:hypothetical protein